MKSDRKTVVEELDSLMREDTIISSLLEEFVRLHNFLVDHYKIGHERLDLSKLKDMDKSKVLPIAYGDQIMLKKYIEDVTSFSQRLDTVTKQMRLP